MIESQSKLILNGSSSNWSWEVDFVVYSCKKKVKSIEVVIPFTFGNELRTLILS